jgi:hypothetical protein
MLLFSPTSFFYVKNLLPQALFFISELISQSFLLLRFLSFFLSSLYAFQDNK